MNRHALLVSISAVTNLLFPVLEAAASPGPSQQFVQATQAMRARWSGAVRNERIDPEWLEAGRLVYRLDGADGGRRFMALDTPAAVALADPAVVQPAFDHAEVAVRLAALLGRDVDPARLPFIRFAAAGDDLLAMLAPEVAREAASPVVRIGVGGALTSAPTVPEAFRATPVRRRASGSGPVTVLFVRNAMDEPVDLHWLDGDGQPRRYETVPPRTTGIRTTFAGHVWSLRVGDREIARVVGGPRPSIVEVPAPEAKPEVEAAPTPAPPTPRSSPPGGPDRSDPDPVRVEVRAGNLVLIDGSGERPLTTDGTASHGFDGRIHWSPGRTRFVAMKVRRATVRTIHFVESRPRDQVQPRLHAMPYAKPGDPRDEPVPWIFDVASESGWPVETELIGGPWSHTDLHWWDEDRFRLLHNERGHGVVRLVEFDAITGSGRTVVEEVSDTFVDYPNKILHRRLADRRILWMSQRTGWNHLYLLDGETGAVIRPLTSGPWLVRSLEAVDEASGTVLLRVMGLHPEQDPYHLHFMRIALDTGARTILTDGDGTHTIERSPDGEFYVARYERVDLPPVTELRRWSDGSRVAGLAEADASALLAGGWPAPERFVAKGRDGTTDIWGVIFRPTEFDPASRYPVIENIYAGPHGHFVPKGWSTWHGHRELAERGFIVVQIDGMGTNWRSKAFHDVAHRNLGDSGFPDRIAWLRAAAATRPWMDLDRVGIHGGSAGGQSATRALIAHGDFYRAAVSDCGCHDNRVDKMWWNELWMGFPIGPHHEAQSNVSQAGRIVGDLLLIVGEMDRNVDPASTMQVVDALIKADKDFELLVIPGAGHGAAGSPYGRRRQAEFFQRKLGGPVAPEPGRGDGSG